jgi:hypothetical protein
LRDVQLLRCQSKTAVARRRLKRAQSVQKGGASSH